VPTFALSTTRTPADASSEHDMHASAHTLPREIPARASHREGALWDSDAVAAVWEDQRGVVGERLAVIEQAERALAEDRLDADLRDRARRAAHMLAGSLGMFGFGGSSSAAAGLESALHRPNPGSAQLAALLADIRREIA
jgi:hypothetical protein